MGVERATVTEQAKASRPAREAETRLEFEPSPSAFPPQLYGRRAEGRAAHRDILYLQRTLGNRAVQRLTSARVQKQETDDPAPGTEVGPPALDQMYRTALSSARQSGDWKDAAEKLNGFSHEDIQTRLAGLTPQELVSMHAGAVANPRVGPDSNVAKLTEAGVPAASTEGPKSSQGPAPAPTPGVTPAPQGKCPKPVADMTNVEKLSYAIDFAREHRDAEMDEQLVTADGQLVRVPAEAAKGGEPSQSTGGGGGGGEVRPLQKGGNSISNATAKALNQATGKNLPAREWGEQ